MAETELTIEGRAVAKRMRYFPSVQGNIGYLHKLVEDAAALEALVPVAEASGDPAALEAVKQSAVACAAAEDSSGNLHMAELMTGLARDLDTALGVLEAGAPPPPLMPPANVDRPYASQALEVLSCTMGNWNNMQDEPHSYSYQWQADGAPVGTASADSAYPVTAADAGRDFYCRLTATNAAGSAVAASNIVTVVAPA